MRTMRTRTMILMLLALIFSATAIDAQVTVGNDTPPQATLDVVGQPAIASAIDGIIAPRLTGNELKAKDDTYGTDQTGAMVYVTAPVTSASAKTANVTAAGYYYFDGTLWHSVSGVDNNTLYDISYESATSLLTLTPSTGGGSPVAIPLPKDTASNGLTKNGNDVQLGGNLTKNTTIAQNVNTLTFSGTGKTVVSTPLQYNNAAASPGADKVLTSDASGNAAWEIPALPMVLGTITGSNQVINMSDYRTSTTVADYVEVPFVSFTLPPGRWLIFYHIPFRFNFNDSTLAQVSFGMGFAPEDDSEWGTASATKFINGVVVNNISHRDVAMGILNNTTSGNVTYTLRFGNFGFRSNSGTTLPATGNITIVPPGFGGDLYAIGVK